MPGRLDQPGRLASAAVWRLQKTLADQGSMLGGAPIGKYVNRISFVSGVVTGVAPETLVFGNDFSGNQRLRARWWTKGGVADPTTVGRVSLYEVTQIADPSGVVFTLGSEVAASVCALGTLAPRGRFALVTSSPFSLDPAKTYLLITETSVAALPESVTFVASVDIQQAA